MKQVSLKKLITVMLGVACGSSSILAIVYHITQAPIQATADANELKAISDVFGGEFDNNPFLEKTIITGLNQKDQFVLYPIRRQGNITGVAIKTYSNKGFGGKLELIVGFTIDGRISSYKVISSHETPGLGSKISGMRFLEQFKGIYPGASDFKVKQDGGNIDAVTAATISSRAVIEAIKKAYEAYHKFNMGN